MKRLWQPQTVNARICDKTAISTHALYQQFRESLNEFSEFTWNRNMKSHRRGKVSEKYKEKVPVTGGIEVSQEFSERLEGASTGSPLNVVHTKIYSIIKEEGNSH